MDEKDTPTSRREFIGQAASLAALFMVTACANDHVDRIHITSRPTAPPSPSGSHPPVSTDANEFAHPRSTTSPTTKPSAKASPSSSPKQPAAKPQAAAPHKGPWKHLPKDGYIQHGPTTYRRLAFTVDDYTGSDALRYLEGVNDLAEDLDIEITHFPIGSVLLHHYRTKATEQWRRAVSLGSVIGNHTHDHVNLTTLDAKGIKSQIRHSDDALDLVLGHDDYPKQLVRPPGGAGGFPDPKGAKPTPLGREFTQVHDVIYGEMGKIVTMWTTDSNTKMGALVTPPPSKQDKRFLDKIFHDPYEHVRNGSIVLIHPNTLSLKAFKTLIQKSQDKGYDLVSVPGLFQPK